MFLKIVKKDLSSNKGLNIILFIFITIACLMLTVSTANIYLNVSTTTPDAINQSDLTMVLSLQKPYTETVSSHIENYLNEENTVKGYTKDFIIPVSTEALVIPGTDTKNNSFLNSHHLKMIKNDRKYNLLYSEDDKPFSVMSGNIAVSVDFSRSLGVKKGDTLEFTSQLGNKYQFRVSEFYKNVFGSQLTYFVISENDYEVMLKDNPVMNTLYEISCTNSSETTSDLLSILSDEENTGFTYMLLDNDIAREGDVVLAISVFVVLICIFLVFIILLSIRFTIQSAVKNETKQIGMMRAAGVDSFGFRTLFAAKYIAFIIAGGIIGITAGIPVSRIFCSQFSANMISPGPAVKYGTGILSVLILMAVMLVSAFSSMKTIDRISVIDAIHGNDRGERFGKVTPVYLHKCRKMSVSTFLALSDIFSRFRRWLIILAIYSFGTMIIFLGWNMENTINSNDYLKLFMYNDTDFSMEFDSPGIDKLIKKSGNLKKLQEELNQQFSDSGIPAEITFDYIQYARFSISGSSETACAIVSGEYDTENLDIKEGGRAPKLKNEVAVGSYTAEKYNINPGDTLKITYRKYTDETRLTVIESTEEFLVTGLINIMESNMSYILCGNEFDYAEPEGYIPVSFKIQGTEKEKEEYVNQMNEIFGAGSFYNSKETFQNSMGYISGILISIKYTISAIVIFIIVLVTVLHYSVMLAEDRKEIAFLKSTGSGSSSVKAIQIKRSLVLLVISLAAGNLLTVTLGNYLTGRIFREYGMAGMTLSMNPADTFIVIPAVLAAAVTITMICISRKTDRIEVNEINSEQ